MARFRDANQWRRGGGGAYPKGQKRADQNLLPTAKTHYPAKRKYVKIAAEHQGIYMKFPYPFPPPLRDMKDFRVLFYLFSCVGFDNIMAESFT